MDKFLPTTPHFYYCQKQLHKAMLICAVFLATTLTARAQTSTETFETEAVGSASFTDNGVVFNIISLTSTFKVVNFANTGWSGTRADNRYIDNTGTVAADASFSIKTTSNLFKVNRFWVYLANRLSNQSASGTLTVTGKLSGITKFTQTKTTGFATSLGVTNGFTLIDLTNLNGQNYSNIVIDQLQLTLGGEYQYISFDAFTWVKDSNLVLPVTMTEFNVNLSKTGLLKADWKTAAEKNNSHFILQSSTDGKSWKDLLRKNAAVNATAGASYQVEVGLGTISMAGFGLLGLLLLPFSNKRLKWYAILGVIAVFGISCAKDTAMDTLELEGDKHGLKNTTIYVRLAQVDLDGTTTYSEVKVVKAQ